MNLWNRYTSLVRGNFNVDNEQSNDIMYWRNLLFANTVIYIIPLSLIALVPSLIYLVIEKMWLMVFTDIIAMVLITLIGFSPHISIQTRRLFFVYCIYSVAISALYLVGLAGPGFLFLYAATIFCIIIFPNSYSYHPSLLNVLVCIIFGFLISLNIMPWADQAVHDLTEWGLNSSNLIFLSFLSSALLPSVFNGFENSLIKEKEMRDKVDQQKKELEVTLKKLENKNKDLEMFAYTSSHDLQEPLRMVTSFLTRLQSKYEDQLDDKAHQYIHYAVDGAKRMRQIIMDLLQFSRAVNLDGEKEMVDLNQLVDDITLLYQKVIQEKKAEIHTSKLPTIYTHRTALHQILLNLISNALKYSKKKVPPEIFVSAEELEDRWIISVKDNGIGIPSEYSEKIYIIFQRLHNKEEYSGTGIGLAIVKKVVENLNGRIWFEANEDVGTTFFFTHPKHEVSL
jgi:signal transduction histidine kinase